ncbi:MAG: hypothetical protein C4342_03590 [Armatimonadota bacterium]
MEHRIEADSLGEVKVPAHAYWGSQAERSRNLFQISGITEHPKMIDAYVILKKACAVANAELGLLDQQIADAIVQAADEVLAGELRDQFPVDVFHMGAGTSFNMNVNEVLANRAEEILGGEKGQYKRVNPNDHVNYAQSTNDTFPTAMRVMSRMMLQDLLPEVDSLASAFENKAREFDRILKSGRTHLQDAVPIRLGQEFAAYAAAIRRRMASARRSGVGGVRDRWKRRRHGAEHAPRLSKAGGRTFGRLDGNTVSTKRGPPRGDAVAVPHERACCCPAPFVFGTHANHERPAVALLRAADRLSGDYAAAGSARKQHHARQGESLYGREHEPCNVPGAGPV